MTALDYLNQGLPNILDRTVWPTFSGGLAGQMLAAFRFLGLINEEYEPTDLLYRAIDPDRRQEAIREAVRRSYEDMVSMGLDRATPKQLSDFLSELYNVNGSTHKKAMTFFLHAAKYVDLPLSPAINRKTRSSSPRRRRSGFQSSNNGNAQSNEEKEDEEAIEVDSEEPKPRGTSRTISLRGGGSATLIFDVDVWSMTAEDQEFVFGMIKRMNEYEGAKRSTDATTQ